MYKLIVSDLDSTLLVDQRIRGKNKEILQKLQSKGVEIGLASGRVSDSIIYLGKEAGLKVHVIGSNGAYAALYDKTCLYKKTISRKTLTQCLEIGQKYGIYYHFYDDMGLVNDRLLPNYDYLMSEELEGGKRFQCGIHYFPNPLEFLDQFNCYKFQWLVKEDDIRKKAIIEDIKALEDVSYTSSGPGLLEVMAKNVDKWHAIKIVAERLGIRDEEIIACGDYNNDIKMLKEAGLGIAPQNALEEVKEAADLISKPSWECGIGYALEELDNSGAFD